MRELSFECRCCWWSPFKVSRGICAATATTRAVNTRTIPPFTPHAPVPVHVHARRRLRLVLPPCLPPPPAVTVSRISASRTRWGGCGGSPRSTEGPTSRSIASTSRPDREKAVFLLAQERDASWRQTVNFFCLSVGERSNGGEWAARKGVGGLLLLRGRDAKDLLLWPCF